MLLFTSRDSYLHTNVIKSVPHAFLITDEIILKRIDNIIKYPTGINSRWHIHIPER